MISESQCVAAGTGHARASMWNRKFPRRCCCPVAQSLTEWSKEVKSNIVLYPEGVTLTRSEHVSSLKVDLAQRAWRRVISSSRHLRVFPLGSGLAQARVCVNGSAMKENEQRKLKLGDPPWRPAHHLMFWLASFVEIADSWYRIVGKSLGKFFPGTTPVTAPCRSFAFSAFQPFMRMREWGKWKNISQLTCRCNRKLLRFWEGGTQTAVGKLQSYMGRQMWHGWRYARSAMCISSTRYMRVYWMMFTFTKWLRHGKVHPPPECRSVYYYPAGSQLRGGYIQCELLGICGPCKCRTLALFLKCLRSTPWPESANGSEHVMYGRHLMSTGQPLKKPSSREGPLGETGMSYTLLYLAELVRALPGGNRLSTEDQGLQRYYNIGNLPKLTIYPYGRDGAHQP